MTGDRYNAPAAIVYGEVEVPVQADLRVRRRPDGGGTWGGVVIGDAQGLYEAFAAKEGTVIRLADGRTASVQLYPDPEATAPGRAEVAGSGKPPF